MSTTPVVDRPKNRFIDPRVLVKIQNLELVARTVVEGFVTGLHKSPYLGFSVDFAEYRPYMAGDDIRRIDWKVFGRSDKLFLKPSARWSRPAYVRLRRPLAYSGEPPVRPALQYPRGDRPG